MPIQYVGKTTYYEGKRLFDILCRLKNFGVGRIVVRSNYLRHYSEPSYFIIQKVEPDMSDPTQVIVVSDLSIGAISKSLRAICRRADRITVRIMVISRSGLGTKFAYCLCAIERCYAQGRPCV